RQREVPRRTPLGKLVIQRQLLKGDLVSQRSEDRAQHDLAAAAGQDRNGRLQRDGGLCQFGAMPRPAPERRPEYRTQGDTEQRRSHVRTVVDVLVKLWARARLPSDKTDGVDLQDKRHGATLVSRLGIEDRRLADRQIERMRLVRVLLEQE